MRKTNIGLVENAKKALSEKWGYVWGTFGQLLTPSLLQRKIKQYPQGVGNFETFIRANWMGRNVADCVGLIKSYIWLRNGRILYTPASDKNANGMFAEAREKGPMSTMPEILGICLFKRGHVGIYIGNGQVIEARGTKAGVIQSPIRGVGSAGWTHWFKSPHVEYIKANMESPKAPGLTEAISILVSEQIINSPEYWLRNAVKGRMVEGEFAGLLIIEMARRIKELRDGEN